MTGGSYSAVYEIGSKILKIGKAACTYKVPKNNKRFLQSLFRFQFPFTNQQDYEDDFRIEIMEKCDTKSNITDDELYELWEDIRRDGMIWTDISKSNVGRLLRDNKIYFNGIENVYKPNLGFEENNDVEVLKKGELVLIDLDYVYSIDSDFVQNSIFSSWGRISQFEDIYQRKLHGKDYKKYNIFRKNSTKDYIKKDDDEIDI